MIEINELIKHPIQLLGVEMVSCKIDKCIEQLDTVEYSNIEVKLKTWANLDKIDKNLGYTYLNIIIDFSEKIKPFFLDITYRGKCSLDNDIKATDKFEKFLETQGLKLLWPYLRVAITDLMIKMDVQPIKLPTIDVLETMKRATIEKE